MNYLIISDLHLGSPLFTKKNEIVKLINSDIYDRIIVNGDIIDTWEVPVAISSKHPVVTALNTISNFNANNKKVIIIKGNHDPKLEELKDIFKYCEVVEEYTFKIGMSKYIAVHGHQFNDIIRTYDDIAKLLFPIQWIFERLNINISLGLRTLYHSISAKIQHKYYNDLVLDIEKTAVNKYKENYNRIILGHTHFPKLINDNGIIYINSGDFIHNNTYAEIIDGIVSINSL